MRGVTKLKWRKCDWCLKLYPYQRSTAMFCSKRCTKAAERKMRQVVG